MYVGMMETRSLKMKSFHENYRDLFKKKTRYELFIDLREVDDNLFKHNTSHIVLYRGGK